MFISNDLHEMGWNIKCLSMGKGQSECSNVNSYPFWIEQKWQEVIGWSMVALFVLMAGIGRTIEFLKKRARRKHRERIKAQMSSNTANQTQPRARFVAPSAGRAPRGPRNLRNRKGRRGNAVVEEEEPPVISNAVGRRPL